MEFSEEKGVVVYDPMKIDEYSIFQMDYRTDELKTMTFELNEKDGDKSYGQFTVDLVNPEREYELEDGASVVLLEYEPDYAGFENGELKGNSPLPNNPVFIFKMITPEKPQGENSFVAIRQTVEGDENDFKVNFVSTETRNVSGMTIRKDKTLYILLAGGIIFLIGVAQGSYWNHRRIWVQKADGNQMYIASHTNKNWFS